MSLWQSGNNVMQTTAAFAAQATGTTIKTHQQLAPPAALGIQVVAFGLQFEAALTAIAKIELIETDVAATVTAHVAAGVQPWDSQSLAAGSSAASGLTLGTSATGYNASAEGTITAVRTGKYVILPIGASQYEWEFTPGREFQVRGGKFGRLRITTTPTINVATWVLHQE